MLAVKFHKRGKVQFGIFRILFPLMQKGLCFSMTSHREDSHLLHMNLSPDIFPWLSYTFCRPTCTKVNWNYHNSTISGMHQLCRKVACVGRTYTKIQLCFIMVMETKTTSRETREDKQAPWEEKILLPFKPWRIKRRARFQDCEILQLCRCLVGIGNTFQP